MSSYKPTNLKTMPFPRTDLPHMARVRQELSQEHIPDVCEFTRQRLLDAGLHNWVRPGTRIAITAGSRGMGGFIELLCGITEAVRAVGAQPFLIPAMGSHGGASGEGQVEVLRRLGVTKEAVNAPVHATMDTHMLGQSSSGALAHIDKFAFEADGIIVLGRVKTHPENFAGVASGLLKMVVVGLGKQSGAQQAHSNGLWDSVKAVPQVTMAKAKIVCGVAVVENAFRKPVVIEVIEPTYDAFRDADTRLLKLSHNHIAQIPFKKLDLLVVDQIGKNISGTGMDMNIIGKWRMDGGKRDPDYTRIVALSLTRESLGNGLGIGLADFTTERFAKEYDQQITYINLLTASEPDTMNTREGPLPLVLSNDREAIEVALFSSLPETSPRVCRIRNTASLDEFWVSPALLEEVKENPKLNIIHAPLPVTFDESNNLI
jgi:hypothetical protein